MAKPKSNVQERPYHHGDLRRVIVRAALEILGETQSLEFSLRELARRAGVSHNAPYKHFADKGELLAAVSAAGFDALAKQAGDEIARIDSPHAQLLAMLRIYIRYGVNNPALYRLMFGGYLSGPGASRPAIERAAADKIRVLLERTIVDGALGHPIPKTPRNLHKIAGAILACWSLIHGLTLLMADGLVGPRAKSDKLSENLLQGMIAGLSAKVPPLPPGAWVGPQRDAKPEASWIASRAR
jgi:AcrR family transcriptional regulator